MESKENPSQTKNLAAHFHIPKGIYLLNHSVGCLPKGDPISPFFASWSEKGGAAWPIWLSYIDNFRSALAKLFKDDAKNFCPQSNCSSALSKILGSLPENGRTNILMHKESFPSLAQVARGHGTLKLTENSWSEALDDQCKIVLITHVLSNSSEKLPVKDIIREAKRKGIYTVIDVAQSVGISAIDLKDWDADFVIGSCVKWLCGGPGAAFLWIKPELTAELHPKDTGWFSAENPFEIDIDSFQAANDARRFWGGTPNIIPYHVATKSIEAMLAIGIENIAIHNKRLTEMLIEGFSIKAPTHRGGTVNIPWSEKLEKQFKKQMIHFDIRPKVGFRLSPHCYNSADEILSLFQ